MKDKELIIKSFGRIEYSKKFSDIDELGQLELPKNLKVKWK